MPAIIPDQDQDRKLAEIGGQIQRIFPDMYGNVFFKFNLKPGRKDVNMNYGVEMSKILSTVAKPNR